MAVVIETTLGDITVDLFVELRPQSCLNFMKLCKMKYYNFNLFHTIQSGFIAQTGDPTGEGTGGESIWSMLHGKEKRYFSCETRPKIRHNSAGLLSMVCVGDGMIGSQFFFTLAPDLDSLDGVHCVIGEVTEGFDVLRKLNEVICDEKHRPYQDVRITHTVILEDPFNDPPKFRPPSRSPSPSVERLAGGRIAPDEELDEYKGKSIEEIQDLIEDKEAKARATILEIVGDLPDAEMAPPENVLFVCKLNSVTTDEDLEIIFSRFGKIVSCEVIRDKKSGDSLQYAFIEFSDKKSCEDAYFKMDNVLIDDRRIHVDFSQSVSKIKWLGKGRGVVHLDGNEKNKEQKLTAIKEKNKSRSHDRHRESQSRERKTHRRSHSRDKKRPQKRERNYRSHSKEQNNHGSESIERNNERIPSKDKSKRMRKILHDRDNRSESRSHSRERINRRSKSRDKYIGISSSKEKRNKLRDRNYRSESSEEIHRSYSKERNNRRSVSRDKGRTPSKDQSSQKKNKLQNRDRSKSRNRNHRSHSKEHYDHKSERTPRQKSHGLQSKEWSNRRSRSKDTNKLKKKILQRDNRSESGERYDRSSPVKKIKMSQRTHSREKDGHRSRSRDSSKSREKNHKSQKRGESDQRLHSKERIKYRSPSREKIQKRHKKDKDKRRSRSRSNHRQKDTKSKYSDKTPKKTFKNRSYRDSRKNSSDEEKSRRIVKRR